MTPGGEPAGTFTTAAEAVLFGFDPAEVQVTIRARARGWRVGGAARTVAVVVAPVVALLPPHAPWPIGVLAVGGILARRRYTERFTVVALEGRCPKCDAALDVKGGRLREPHPLPCEACHHESSLRIAADVLTANAADS